MREDKLHINDELIQKSWDDMKSLLDREMPVKRRRMAAWLAAAGLAILLLAGGAIAYQQISGDKSVLDELKSYESGEEIASSPFRDKVATDIITQENPDTKMSEPISDSGLVKEEEVHAATRKTNTTEIQKEQAKESETQNSAIAQTNPVESATVKAERKYAGFVPIEKPELAMDSGEKAEDKTIVAGRENQFRDILNINNLNPNRSLHAGRYFLFRERIFHFPELTYFKENSRQIRPRPLNDPGFWTYGSISSYGPEAISGFNAGLAYEYGISKSFGLQLSAGISSHNLYWDEGRQNLSSRFDAPDTEQDPTVSNPGGQSVVTPTRQIEFQDYLALISSAWFFESGIILNQSFGKLHLSSGSTLYYTMAARNDTELGVQTVSSSYLADNDYINRFTIGLLGRVSYDLGGGIRAHVSYNHGLSNLYRNLQAPPSGFVLNSQEMSSLTAVQLKNRYFSFGVMMKL